MGHKDCCDCCDDDCCKHDDCCERGKRGKRGKTGHKGPPGKSINLLKFSGLAAVSGESEILTTYLADTGAFGTPPLTLAPNYPVPAPFEVGSFAANLLTSLVVPDGEFAQFQLVKNGSQVVATIAYNPGDSNGIKSITFAPVAFAVNDTIDVRVVTSAGLTDETETIAVSAMVGP